MQPSKTTNYVIPPPAPAPTPPQASPLRTGTTSEFEFELLRAGDGLHTIAALGVSGPCAFLEAVTRRGDSKVTPS